MGLTLTSSYQNQDFFDPNFEPKSTFRKAGEVFEPKSFTPDSEPKSFTPDSSQSNTMIADMYQDDDKKISKANSTDLGQKVDTGWKDASGSKVYKPVVPASEQKPSSTPELGTYDEDQYKYYVSDFGTGQGASAYAEDMKNYQGMVDTNNGDSLIAGKMGLIAQMMHPDWGASQKTGGGNPIQKIDHSKPSDRYYMRTKGGAFTKSDGTKSSRY